MKTDNVKKITLTAMFMAMTCVSTMFLSVPNGTGYTNLGDAFVLLGAFFLGPVYGTVAGGVGSALADLLAGYGYYVPGTLLIKGLCALLAALFVHKLSRGKQPLIFAGAGAVLAELWMVLGYFLYKWLILGKWISALESVPKNLIQAAAGVGLSLVMFAALRKIKQR